jgi:hypothetical protein
MNIDLGSINWLAVGVAAFATFMLGGVWYTALFGKVWQRLNGYSDEKLVEMRRHRPPPVFFGTMIACYVVVSLLMAVMVGALEISSATSGAMLGCVVFVLAVAVQVTGQIASDKPMKAMLIDLAYQAVYMPLTGAILGAWR